MTSFHAVVWLDHQQAHVLMFDRSQIEAQHIKARSHHKHQGKAEDIGAYFKQIARALHGSQEILLCGPGQTRQQWRDWVGAHDKVLEGRIVDNVAADHPSDGQLVAMARQYFLKYDAMN
jgi:stalled ribosome rescue protein Dom34